MTRFKKLIHKSIPHPFRCQKCTKKNSDCSHIDFSKMNPFWGSPPEIKFDENNNPFFANEKFCTEQIPVKIL